METTIPFSPVFETAEYTQSPFRTEKYSSSIIPYSSGDTKAFYSLYPANFYTEISRVEYTSQTLELWKADEIIEFMNILCTAGGSNKGDQNCSNVFCSK